MEDIKSKLDAYLGMESVMHLFPDHYLAFHYASPTGVSLFSVYYIRRDGVWEYFNTTHNLLLVEEGDVAAAPLGVHDDQAPPL